MWAAAPYRSEVGRAALYWLSEDKRALLRKCMHFNEHITQIWNFLWQLASSPTGHGASSWVSLHFSPHIGTLAAMVAGLVSLDCDAPCAKEDPRSCGTWASGDSSPSRAFPRRGVRWLLTFAHFSRTVASGDSSPSRAFPCRGIRWLLTLARFLMQGHQVTPHLRAFMRWLLCTARAPYHLEWVRERSPLHTAAADVGLVSCEWEGILYSRLPLMLGWFHVNESVPLHMAATDVGLVSCEWECPLHMADHCWGAGIVWIREQCLPDTAATDEGLVSCEWESSVFQTRQPLMRGWYRVNERAVFSRHGSHWWGAGIVCNKRAVSSRNGSHWWGAGIVWMIEETSDYVLHTAEHCSEAGGCMLRQWLFCAASAATWKPLAPVFFPRLAAPPWKGDARSRVAVLSCRFNGWEECGHSRHKLITKVLKSTTGQGQIDSY